MTCIISSLMKTGCNWSATIARLALGIVMLPHGLQKTVGMFGGYGFSGTMEGMTSSMGLPAVIVFLVIAAESAGAIGLIVGFMTRFCAASIAVVMAGAVLLVHANNGFFMNWFGKQAGEGYEYHLLAIGLALSLVVSGGGALSVDGRLSKSGSCGEGSCCK